MDWYLQYETYKLKHESIIKNLAESLQKFLYTEHIFIQMMDM